MSSSKSKKNDPIKQYTFVFNKLNYHIAVAQRQSNEFDIYYDGNRIDDAPKKVSN